MDKQQILVVDDDESITFSLKIFLGKAGYRVDTTASGLEAWNLIETKQYPLILSDISLPGMTGKEILKKVKTRGIDCELILFTGYGSVRDAVDCIKNGAYDYFIKPVDNDKLLMAIERALEHKALRDENRGLRKKLGKNYDKQIVFCSKTMEDLLNKAKIAAETGATILITGTSGTGKTRLAKYIHNHSKKRDQPFVEVSCGVLSENLLESELFGHKKGAFTGAVSDKKGKFEAAKDGTIFLDDINSASMGLQTKLLRVIEQKIFEPVGDTRTLETNARVIAATNHDLLELSEKKVFREDLFHRLNVISFGIPSLRERKEDIPVLIHHFMANSSDKYLKPIKMIDENVLVSLSEYSWPGNVRELENIIERAVIFSQNNEIKMSDIPEYIVSNKKTKEDEVLTKGSLKLSRVSAMFEKVHILRVLKMNHSNRNKTAESLGISRATLFNKMKKYDMLGNNEQKM